MTTVGAKLANLPELAVLAGIALVGAIVLAATSHPVPSSLWTITYVLVGSAAGVSLPNGAGTVTNVITPKA